MSLAEDLTRGCKQQGLKLAAEVCEKLLIYLNLLDKWNKVYNLTAIRAEDKVVSHHLLDSLAVLPFVPKGRLLDAGSGAGLPGLPLAVVNPDLHVTLLDSNHKKSAFQRQAIAELGLSNVLVVSARAENYQVKEKFSAIISRAFADLTTFVEVTSHLIRPEGAYLAMKGVYPNEELEQLSSKANLQSVQRLQVAGLDAERHLVILRPSRLEVSA